MGVGIIEYQSNKHNGLTTLDLSPLSQLKVVLESFLSGCTGSTTLVLSPLSQLKVVLESILELHEVDAQPFY